MPKRKKKALSPKQKWAVARNSAKGQLSFMRGTAKTAISSNALTKKEESALRVMSQTLSSLLYNWEDSSSSARQERMDTWD